MIPNLSVVIPAHRPHRRLPEQAANLAAEVFLLGQIATVNGERRACNKTRFQRSEISDKAGDLPILSHAAKGHEWPHRRADIFVAGHVGFGRAGLYSIYR